MGRTFTPKYRLLVDSGSRNWVNTPMSWNVSARKSAPGLTVHGKPTAENLAKFVDAYCRSLEKGGSNFHVSAAAGHIPYPNWARVEENRPNGRVVAEWKAPMFMAVGG
jgi:hypothetical protein